MAFGHVYTVYLGLGSSLGNRLQHIQDAVNYLAGCRDADFITVEAMSAVYESPHMGLNAEDESEFPAHLNAAICVSTNLEPHRLLQAIHEVERAGGRERLVHWGPRTIDIDILLVDGLTIQTAELTVPHPGLQNRAFVVLPLADIAPEIHLANGETVRSAAARIMRERPTIVRTTAEIHNPCGVGRV